MKKVLLLTDFSKASENAVYYAVTFFKQIECTFFILFVKEPDLYTTDDLITSGNKSLYESLIQNPKIKLKKFTTHLKTKFKNSKHQFEEITDYDPLIESVKQVVTNNAIDIIVMGSNGVSDTKEVIFGTNTLNMIRNVDCPTMVIPEFFADYIPSNVMIPINKDDDLFTANKLQEGLSFLVNENYKLNFLLIKEDSKNSATINSDLNSFKNVLSSFEIKIDEVHDVPMPYAVDSYLQTQNIDLMLFFAKKEFFLERFFLGSDVTKIGRVPQIPMLIIHY